jgi:hypothetical protein
VNCCAAPTVMDELAGLIARVFNEGGTVSEVVPVIPENEALIVVDPLAIALHRPVEEMLATATLDDDQATEVPRSLVDPSL